MSHYIVKAKKTYLKSPLSTSAGSVVLRYLKDSKDNNLSLSDFGAFGVIVIKQGDTIEMIKFDGVSINGTTGVATLTVATNGRNINPTYPYAGSSTGNSFQSGADVIVTNDPLTVMQFGNINNVNTWALQQTFTVAPKSSADAVSADELVRKSQLDSAVLGSLTITPVVVEAVGGEALAVDTLVYQKDADGEWYKCDADTANTVDNVRLGITRGACASDGSSITNGVTILGTHQASSALFTANTKYYASNTAGGFSTSAGTNEVSIGFAISTTKIILYPRFDQQLTEKQQDLLALLEAGSDFYGASSGGTDTYAVTLDPVPTAYTNGMRIRFKADVPNTGACSLNVNGLGAVAIKRNHDQDPADGEIEANQIVEVVYNSTTPSFQIVSQSSLLSGVQIDTYLSNDTWTKPTGAKLVEVICIGAGGGGGSGGLRADNNERGGTGGGGGAVSRATFRASDLDSTEAVVVGTGGAGGASQTSNSTSGNNGSAGGISSFGTRLYAGGGGGGLGGVASTASAGGGGGGSLGSASGATGGVPTVSSVNGISGQGVTGANNAVYHGEWGGGSGGYTGSSNGNNGGSSIFGGGAGGSGGSTNGTGTTNGGDGGTCGAYTAGGGGAGGVSGANGTAGSANSVLKKGYCGAGGGGGGSNGSAPAGAGGAGGFPAGGGGGGGGGEDGSASGAGGAGANGQVIVITYF